MKKLIMSTNKMIATSLNTRKISIMITKKVTTVIRLMGVGLK